MNKLHSFMGALFFVMATTHHAYALTNLDIMGEWSVTGIWLQYPYYNNLVITQNDLTAWEGRASISKSGLVAEVEGYYQSSYYWKWGAGFYTVSGSKLTATIVGEGSKNYTVGLSGNTMTFSGSDYDPYGDFYNFTYTLTRTERLYTQNQLDQAINSATAGLYTQDQLDQAVADAVAVAEKPRLVVVPLGD